METIGLASPPYSFSLHLAAEVYQDGTIEASSEGRCYDG